MNDGDWLSIVFSLLFALALTVVCAAVALAFTIIIRLG